MCNGPYPEYAGPDVDDLRERPDFHGTPAPANLIKRCMLCDAPTSITSTCAECSAADWAVFEAHRQAALDEVDARIAALRERA